MKKYLYFFTVPLENENYLRPFCLRDTITYNTISSNSLTSRLFGTSNYLKKYGYEEPCFSSQHWLEKMKLFELLELPLPVFDFEYFKAKGVIINLMMREGWVVDPVVQNKTWFKFRGFKVKAETSIELVSNEPFWFIIFIYSIIFILLFLFIRKIDSFIKV